METEWCLKSDIAFDSTYFFIMHIPCDGNYTRNYPSDNRNICWRCGKQIPNNIIIQWRLLFNED